MKKPRSRAHRSADATTTSAAVNDGLQRTFSPAAESWTAYTGRPHSETYHFAGACLGRYLEAADRFARCRSLADVVDAQAQFIGELLSDFVDEGAVVASALYESAAQSPDISIGNGVRT
jgi:hypothetical protein